MIPIRRISSGGVYEPQVGYCRAVLANGFVFVAGTVGQGSDVVEQCRNALGIIDAALTDAGSSMERVLQVRYTLPDRSEFEACWPVLHAAFGDNPPAATMIQAGLIDPRYRIEIEVTALAG